MTSTPSGSRPDPQPAAEHLDEAWRRMSFEVLEGRFVLAGFEQAPRAADLEALGEGPGQLIREGGETSLLIAADGLQALRERHPNARLERDLVWIRFRAPMSWDVVGFLARVTSELAKAGVPLGAVCGFSRDHLFVHESFLEDTTSVLSALFEQHTPS